MPNPALAAQTAAQFETATPLISHKNLFKSIAEGVSHPFFLTFKRYRCDTSLVYSLVWYGDGYGALSHPIPSH